MTTFMSIAYIRRKKQFTLNYWEFDMLLIILSLISEVEVKVKSLSRVQLFATPWTVAYHPPLSMGFSRQ